MISNSNIDVNYLYESCSLCPRNCKVNRHEKTGYCNESSELRIACASIHKGEEPLISGSGGSGTIFVSGCNLGCIYCQNFQISQKSSCNNSLGRIVSNLEFAQICKTLEKEGAENINIVTGSHVIPAISLGIDIARDEGLKIPIVWNSSAYENVTAVEFLRGRVDVFLPDLKTLDPMISKNFFNAPDYPKAAAAAIIKMTEISNNVIVRHLVIPEHLESTKNVLKWFSDNLKSKVMLSLLTQWTPAGNFREKIPLQYLNENDYETIIKWLEEFEIDNGYCQELVTGNAWLPDFKKLNPFSSELSKPVWHWSCGFVRSVV
jgi:putative pyruvate formate lyase activating enzyme